MPAGQTTFKNLEKIPHSEIVYEHLKSMGFAANEMFKRDMDSGQLKGSTPENKIDSFLASVLWLETLFIELVCETDSPLRITDYNEKYFLKRTEFLDRFQKHMDKNELKKAFFVLDEWVKVLLIEAFNHDLLMKRGIYALK